MPATSAKYLGVYLSDHLAGSTGGLELAKRAAGEYEGTELGAFLARLRDEIADDRRTLEALMDQLDVHPLPVKQAAAWAAEKAGRLKLNGELRGRSPLTPMVELEALSVGIEGKRLMWVALRDLDGLPLSSERFAELAARAERQRDGVEEHRLRVARGALS